MFRVCVRCNISKPLEEFSNRKDRPSGKCYYCRECGRKQHREYSRKVYANPKRKAELLIQKRKDYAENLEKYKIRNKRNYVKHREQRLTQEKENYMRNPDKKRKTSNDYRKRKMAENPNWKKLTEMARKVGITYVEMESWFNKQWMKQQAQCANCGKVFNGDDCIDHNHSTKKLRGLLCSGCNLGIGHLRDSAEICNKAAEYLIKYNK